MKLLAMTSNRITRARNSKVREFSSAKYITSAITGFTFQVQSKQIQGHAINMTHSTIAIIGGGNMGASLAGGLIANRYPAEKIWVTDSSSEKLAQLKKQWGIHTTHDNAEAARHADVVIFAVKQKVLEKICLELAEIIKIRKSLVISVVAGTREAKFQQWLGGHCAIVRCMPNMPALIGCGASALFANALVSSDQHNLAESILRAVGIVVWVENETSMDPVTAVSGCGPAYFFLVMDILQQAGEKLGLSKEVARSLTLQTALGAARMASESDTTTAELCQRVASPGGATEQALRVLEEGDFRQLFTKAIEAANNRAKEIAMEK